MPLNMTAPRHSDGLPAPHAEMPFHTGDTATDSSGTTAPQNTKSPGQDIRCMPHLQPINIFLHCHTLPESLPKLHTTLANPTSSHPVADCTFCCGPTNDRSQSPITHHPRPHSCSSLTQRLIVASLAHAFLALVGFALFPLALHCKPCRTLALDLPTVPGPCPHCFPLAPNTSVPSALLTAQLATTTSKNLTMIAQLMVTLLVV